MLCPIEPRVLAEQHHLTLAPARRCYCRAERRVPARRALVCANAAADTSSLCPVPSSAPSYGRSTAPSSTDVPPPSTDRSSPGEAIAAPPTRASAHAPPRRCHTPRPVFPAHSGTRRESFPPRPQTAGAHAQEIG